LTPQHEAGFRAAIARVTRAFELEGYRVDCKFGDVKTVASVMIKFPGLPYEVGISPHASETLSVKVEVDTNPLLGAITETSLVRRHVTLRLCHHDKASLLARKLAAVLTRRYTKGRDIYDLIWYLADRTWPAPNLELMNAALAQSGWKRGAMSPTNWREHVRQKVETLDWDKVRADVRPFLERERDVDLLTAEGLGSLLK
jgi:hypothetical protein